MRERDREHVIDNSLSPVMVNSNTQTSSNKNGDVIAEFSPTNFTKTTPDMNGKSRKREFEVDSNSGTWPKSRSGIMITAGGTVVPSTVTVPQRERPSIKDPNFFQPPVSHKGSGDRGGVYHSKQGSDSSGVHYPANVSSPMSPQTLTPSPKSSFTVRVSTSTSSNRDPIPRHLLSHTPPHIQYSHYPPPHHPPHPRQPPAYHKTGHSSKYMDPRGPVPLHHHHGAGSKGDGYRHRHRPPPERPQPISPVSPPTHPYSPTSLSPDSSFPGRPPSLDVSRSFQAVGRVAEDLRVGSPVGSSVGSGLSSRSAGPASSSYTNYSATIG